MNNDPILRRLTRIATDLNPDPLKDDIAEYYLKGMFFCFLWPVFIGALIAAGFVFIYLIGLGLGMT